MKYGIHATETLFPNTHPMYKIGYAFFLTKNFTGCERRMHLSIYLLIFRPGLSLETDSGYKNKNIGFYPKSLRLFLRIVCDVNNYAYRRIFSGLSKDAFGTHASLRLQSLVFTLWFNFCSQIIFALKV